MRPQMTNLTQLLGRIREIESRINPQGTSPRTEETRFVEVQNTTDGRLFKEAGASKGKGSRV